MILVVHKDGLVIKIISHDQGELEQYSLSNKGKLHFTLIELGARFPDQIIVWVREEWENWVNNEEIARLIPHPLVMISFCGRGDVFQDRLDYLDYSTSMKIADGVRYPTWKMSASVGAAFGKLLMKFSSQVSQSEDENYFFYKVSRNLQPYGLQSYRDPKLLREGFPQVQERIQSIYSQFRFARKELALQWGVFLLFCFMIYEYKFPVFSFLFSLVTKKTTVYSDSLEVLKPEPVGVASDTIDILIPTLGREQYVHQLLIDISNQSLMPKSVIIIEQESTPGVGSQMEFLHSENWPFSIKHEFTKDRGPCMARNIGLDLISSNWVFLADDDIRISPDFLELVLGQMKAWKVGAATVSCLLPNQKETHNSVHQTRIFGAGCSIVKKEILDQIRFDTAYEFGYAEDSDFGAQIRNLGYDVVYLPSPSIIHLKAPMGGFRSKIFFPWSYNHPKLKPSPTVMLFWLRHFSANQFKGNKLMIFFSFFSKSNKKKSFQFLSAFRKNWNTSLSYAEKLHSGELKTHWNGID